VIPVEKKKDGTYSARSSVMTREELQAVSDFVNKKVKNIGREILDGRISMDPYEKGTAEACTYCSYKKVCGFDSQVPGYEKRKLAALSKDEAMEKIKRQYQE
jgi:ATP-dependent helicase/nuclease subunit B